MAYLWFTRSIRWGWLPNGMLLELTTDIPTLLTMHWTYTPPGKQPFYRIQRGLKTLCGFTWKLYNTQPFPQHLPAFDTTKRFTVTPWGPGRQAWWYFSGYTIDGLSLSTSIIYTAVFPGPTSDAYPLAPEIITAEPALIHNGNHYTFWSAPYWYAVLPFPDYIQIYKRTPLGWEIQDEANQPTAPPATFAACDARINSTYTTIHIASYLAGPEYPPDSILYHTYNCLSDTWSPQEIVSQSITPHHPIGRCSISLDSADLPHIVFPGPFAAPQHLYYTNRTAGSWSAPQPFLSRNWANWMGTSAAHDPDDTFHAAATSSTGFELHYNNRPAPGPIQAPQLLDASVANLYGPGLSTFLTNPHIAVTDLDLTLQHLEGPAPWVSQTQLYPPPSRFPSLLTPPTAVHRRYAFAIAYGQTIQLLWWKAGIWRIHVLADPETLHRLAATYLLPSVQSYLAVKLNAPTHTRFWAFLPPL